MFMNHKRIGVAGVVLSTLALLPGCASRSDFTLKTLNGSDMTLSKQQDKAILLAFFAHG